MDINKKKQLEVIFWSIAFPGFGQLINRKFIKGFFFILLEMIINVKGNINVVIVKSFLWEMDEAIAQTNYLWLMFYPCVYLFAIWDSYRDASGGESSLLFLPFVFSAYFGTLGIIYSSRFMIKGVLFGPVFLSIACMIIGFGFGGLIRKIIIHKYHLQ